MSLDSQNRRRMSGLSLEELGALVAQGSEEAFNELFGNNGRLKAWAEATVERAVFPQTALAHCALSSAISRLWFYASKFDGRSYKAFSKTVLMNESRRHLKKANSRARLLGI